MGQTLVLALVVVLVVVVLGSGIWVPLLYWLAERRAQRRFDALAAAQGLPAGGRHFELGAGGQCVTVTLSPPTRGEPRLLQLAIRGLPATGRDGARILLRPEGPIDRLGKHLGINREVQIGEPAFDDAVYIESDVPDEAVLALLGDERRRRAVIEILALGFSRVEVHGSSVLLLAASRARPGEKHFAPATIERVAAALAELAPAVPEPGPRPGRRSVTPQGILGALAFVVAGLVALVLGFGALGIAFAARDAFPPVGDAVYRVAVPAGFGVVAALVPVAAFVLRGRSDSFRTLGITLAVGLYVVPCHTVAVILSANGALDGSRPVRHASRIVGHSQINGKHTAYHLRLAGWRGGDDVGLEVDRATFDRFAEGDAVTVTTGEGALGWPWIRRIDPKKR